MFELLCIDYYCTGSVSGNMTSVYATFPITNSNSGFIKVRQSISGTNAFPGSILMEFYGPFQTPTNYNGNKPSSFVAVVDYNSGPYEYFWMPGGAMPIPPPPKTYINELELPRSLTTVSNGVFTSNVFVRTRRFCVKPTNSTSIASASIWPSFSFTAQQWVRYQPKWTPVLDQTNWFPLGGPIMSEISQVITVSDTNNAVGQAFYRVNIQ